MLWIHKQIGGIGRRMESIAEILPWRNRTGLRKVTRDLSLLLTLPVNLFLFFKKNHFRYCGYPPSTNNTFQLYPSYDICTEKPPSECASIPLHLLSLLVVSELFYQVPRVYVVVVVNPFSFICMEQPSAEFLNSNFEYLASLDPPGVVRQLPPLHDGGGLLPHDFQLSVPEGAIGQKIVPSIILQVNEVADVSLPLAQRLREIAPTGTDTEGVCTEITEPGSLEETLRSLESKDNSARHHGRRQRLLRLVLTDGFVRVFAVEDCRRGCDALRTGVVLGSKLRLFAPLRLLNGVIILESEKTELLGGFVKEIQSFWEDYAVKKLHELSGRPGRIAQASSATNTNTNTNTATFSSAPAPRIAGDTNHSGVAPGPTQQQHQKQQQRQQQQQQLLEYRHQTNEGVSGPVVQPSPPAAASAQPTPPTRPAARLTPTPEPLSHPRVTQEYFVPATPTPEQPPTATPPFSTAIGKITDVMSDLTIRDGENCSPGEPPSFSLKVLLSVQQPLPPSLDVGEDGAIVVDLGNAWLQRALGMNVASFRSLTSSQLPNDLARINQLVDEVGRTLENFGIAEFHIRRRLSDGILEVVHVRQLE